MARRWWPKYPWGRCPGVIAVVRNTPTFVEGFSPKASWVEPLRIRDETMMDREERQLEPVRHAGFVEDTGQVVLDRVLADGELLRKVLVRVAGDHQRENLPLAPRQAITRGRRCALAVQSRQRLHEIRNSVA